MIAWKAKDKEEDAGHSHGTSQHENKLPRVEEMSRTLERMAPASTERIRNIVQSSRLPAFSAVFLLHCLSMQHRRSQELS